MNQERYERTELELIRFSDTDVILSSDPDEYELEKGFAAPLPKL